MKKYELSAENAWDMAQGIYTGLTTDPIGFGKELGKSLLDWDTWADDPARAIGHLVPDAIVAVATAGTGALATRGAKGGLDALDALSDLNKLDNLADLEQARPLRRAHRAAPARRPARRPARPRQQADRRPHARARSTASSRPATRSGSSPARRCSGSSRRARSTTTCAAARTPTTTSGPTRPSASPRAPRTSTSCTRPREMHDKLGLDYKLPDGSHQFTPDQSDIHVLRYDQTDPGELVVPRHERLGGDGFNDQAMDPDNPFTGTGYTSGGIPEFRTDTADHHARGLRDLADGQLGRPGAASRCSRTTWGPRCGCRSRDQAVRASMPSSAASEIARRLPRSRLRDDARIPRTGASRRSTTSRTSCR